MSIQVSVENVHGLEQRLKVCVPVEQVDKVIEGCFQKVAQTVKIDGFRPGKVPRRIIEERYGESIRHQEALPKLIDETLGDAFKQVDVSPVGRPELEGPIDFLPHQDLNYSVLFEVFPEIVLKDLKDVEVEQIVSEVTDADLEKALERILQEHTKWEEAKSPAQKDDNVLLNYTVEVDGQLIDEAAVQNKAVQLGKHANTTVIAALEDQLAGLSSGDEKILDATFPDDYPLASVAGKPAKFKVTILSIQRPEVPVLDDAFAKRFDEAVNIEEYKKNIRKSMDYYLKTALMHINKLEMFDALVEANLIELPKAMVQAEIERMAKGFLKTMFKDDKLSTQDVKKYLPFLSKMYGKAAKKRVRLGLLFEEFLKAHPQTVSDEMIQNTIEERSALYQDPKAWIEEYSSVPANKEEMRSILLEIAVADRLREVAKIKSVSLDYFAVLEKEKALQYRDMDMEAAEAPAEEEHVHDESCGHAHHSHDHNHEHHHEHHDSQGEKANHASE